MTTDPASATRGGQARTMPNDLLQDLRQAAPAAPTLPRQDRSRAPGLISPRTAAVEMRFTPRRWLAPALRRLPAGDGLVLQMGPLRLAVGYLSA